jgi:predicted DNA-binding transcriptional regulator AlpA
VSLDDIVRECVREEVARRMAQIRDPARDVALTTKQVSEMTGLAVGTLVVGRCRNRNPSKYAPVDVPPHREIGARIVYMRGEVVDWLEERRGRRP